MKRKVVKIDEEKCDGCGLCIPNCAEGALQIIDGKARLISDLFCDGLGACLGHCPQDAIKIEEREAEPYDEMKVMDYITKGGKNVILAHLFHLKDHNETVYLQEALNYLKQNNIPISMDDLIVKVAPQYCACPGSKEEELHPGKSPVQADTIKRSSELRHWPVQLHLINPAAAYYHNADVVLAADCTAFASGDFHKDFIAGKSIAIACPKLDSGKDIYVNKLLAMIEQSRIRSLTVIIMEVPCCRGLLQLAEHAINLSGEKLPLKVIVLNIQGNVAFEKTISAD